MTDYGCYGCFYLGMLGINLVPVAFYRDLSRIRSISDQIRITSRLFRLYGVEPIRSISDHIRITSHLFRLYGVEP